MKEILLKFINSYSEKIIIDIKNVNYIQYENKEEIYIDLGKQDLTKFLFMLEQDFEIEEIISNLEEGFLVYEFDINNDTSLGKHEITDYGFNEIFNLETKVLLISRHYKKVYHSYLNTKEWHDKRNKMLKYANYKCSRCENTEKLQIHHLNYNTIGEESLSDLEVVCVSCHKIIHKIK
tara:strand:+ start:110 stop:643 length:534 start_codon:yes stop_codon:yes gene_type:complete